MGPSMPLTTGDGGLWTTAKAFTKWLHHQNRDLLGFGSMVTVPEKLTGGELVEYGWGVGLRNRSGKPHLIHGGEWTGCTAMAVRGPSTGMAVTALSGGLAIKNLSELIEAVLDAFTFQRDKL